MTYKQLCDMVYSCGLESISKIHVIDPKNKKRYAIKGMSRYGTDSGSLEFGIIELEEEVSNGSDN